MAQHKKRGSEAGGLASDDRRRQVVFESGDVDRQDEETLASARLGFLKVLMVRSNLTLIAHRSSWQPSPVILITDANLKGICSRLTTHFCSTTTFDRPPATTNMARLNISKDRKRTKTKARNDDRIKKPEKAGRVTKSMAKKLEMMYVALHPMLLGTEVAHSVQQHAGVTTITSAAGTARHGLPVRHRRK